MILWWMALVATALCTLLDFGAHSEEKLYIILKDLAIVGLIIKILLIV